MKNLKLSALRTRRQAGFTLIEIMVALAILTVLALLASSAFDGSRSKAQTMISLARQVGDANIQLKTDTGCFVRNPEALFEPAAAQIPGNNWCGRTFGNTWARPYLAQYPVNDQGELVIDKISAGVTVNLTREEVGQGAAMRKRYLVNFNNVPTDILRQALVECNNTDATNGDLNNDRCRVTGNVTEDAPGTFTMLYDTAR